MTKEMFDRQSIHVALLIWGCIFSLIAALCMFMSKNFDREKRKHLIHMELACAVLLLNDALAWWSRGGMGEIYFVLVRLSNFLVFLFSDMLLLLFHSYVCCCLFEDSGREEGAGRRRVVYGIAVVGMCLVVMSQFTNLYYYFDAENFYHRTRLYVIALGLPVLGMLLDLSLLIQYGKNIGRQLLVSMISYIVLPLAAGLIQVFYYGISLINIAISISMILMFITAVIEQNQKLAEREKEAADMRIALMLSQITPHFIYNTLTTIQELCHSDPEMAEETVEEFAGYLRGNLHSLNRREPLPFEQELQHVRYYLDIEKKRFGDRVRVVYQIKETDFQIPALTLQPVVENAVKHGLCKKKGGGTVLISTEKTKAGIQITVKDDGVGFDPEAMWKEKSGHIGLRNVKERIADISGGEMKLYSVPGQGTEVRMIFPWKGEENVEGFGGRR